MATLQLINTGPQDMYLTGNPQITYFKVVYRRHTNFTMEEMVIKTIPKPLLGSGVHVEIPKYGDLFHKLSLTYKAQNIYVGHGLANPTTALIDNISLNINGHEIDKQYGHWIETWYELTKQNTNGTISNITQINDCSISHLSSALDIAIANSIKYSNKSIDTNAVSASFSYFDHRLTKLTNILGSGIGYPPTTFQRLTRSGGTYCEPQYLIDADFVTTVNTNIVTTAISDNFAGSDPKFVDYQKNTGSDGGSILGLCKLEIPFWFSKDPGLSIPLIALQNPDIIVKFQFAGVTDAYFTNTLMTDEKYISHNGPNDSSSKENCFNAFTNLKPLISNDSNQKINFDIDVNVLYIYLDTDERRRFASVSHEYLIEQVQYISNRSSDLEIELSTFSHPVKEIIWTGAPYRKASIRKFVLDDGAESDDVAKSKILAEKFNTGEYAHVSGVRFQPSDKKTGNNIDNTHAKGFGGFASNVNEISDNMVGKFVVGLLGPSTPSCLDNCEWSISLNGIERTVPQPLQIYTQNNVERYHSGFGSVSCPDSIAVYSFALKPEEHQPSGSCNFSKISDAKLKRITSNTKRVDLNIYCVNYNILRFMGGQCSIAYNL